MFPLRTRGLSRQLPAWGVVAVLLGVLVLAGVVVLAQAALARARQRAHLHAALPKLRSELCQQRDLLARAIDAYRRSWGAYPPDHVISRQPLAVDAVTNQLLYELLGSVHDAAKDTFSPPQFPTISGALLQTFFDTNSLLNTTAKPELVRQFLAASNISATVAIHNKPDVAVLGYFPGWEGMDPDLFQQIELSSWRYNSSAPIHNPKAYDLWIEVKTAETNVLIGNW